MQIALTREVSPSIVNCELTHLARQPIDISLARAQHHRYEQALGELGCAVLRLPLEHDLPDSVFVEDTAIVLDELALITRPGADSRKPEIESIARALAPYRELVYITPPGTVDGGDVLRVGRKLFVGLSARSNPAAVEQMRAALAPHGYAVEIAPVDGCLHLKSAVTQVAPDTLLINPNWTHAAAFEDYDLIEIDPSEPHAANGLLVGETVIYPAAFPATRRRLEARGIAVKTVDVSELAKAEGAVTCCSLVFAA